MTFKVYGKCESLNSNILNKIKKSKIIVKNDSDIKKAKVEERLNNC